VLSYREVHKIIPPPKNIKINPAGLINTAYRTIFNRFRPDSSPRVFFPFIFFFASVAAFAAERSDRGGGVQAMPRQKAWRKKKRLKKFRKYYVLGLLFDLLSRSRGPISCLCSLEH
jgi:hypothetical protein